MPELISPGALHVPDEPIVRFIEGDGAGIDSWPAAKLVLDAATAKHRTTAAWKEGGAGRAEGVRRDRQLAARRDR